MTREEIIDFCEMKSQLEPENEDIFNYIIKALEQEPCEDAVSRQQAISSIRNLYPGRPFVKLNLKKWQEENKKYFECENIIKALPSVTPLRKKGKWIVVDNIHSQCMECGAIFCISSSDEWGINYCPNCGAEMESEE